MTKIFIVFGLIISFFSAAKSDTIDFWHIYYNDVEIKAYNQFARGDIILKIKDIRETDSLVVKYFRDTPCLGCDTYVEIENAEHSIVAEGVGRGTYNPIKISVYDIAQYHLKFGNEHYAVFYRENQYLKKRVLIFNLKFE
jgi:hypothetical protein